MSQSQDEFDPRVELTSLVEDTRRHLEWLDDAGVTHLPVAHAEVDAPVFRSAPPGTARPAFLGGGGPQPRPAPTPPPRPATPPVESAPSRPTPPVESTPPRPQPPPPAPATPSPPAAAAAATPTVSADDRLRVIRAELGACRRCKLCEPRNTIVYGQGNARARVVFVGEAPGEEEDLSGVPFVGRAGQLLTKMIEGMGLTRDEVYVTTIVKCRTPEDRRVEPDEVAACRPFVEEQLRAVQPKVIVALGAAAAHALLGTQESIVTLRHKWAKWEGIDVMPTFHPAYLLKAPAQKRPAWEDLKLVMGKLGLSPHSR